VWLVTVKIRVTLVVSVACDSKVEGCFDGYSNLQIQTEETVKNRKQKNNKNNKI
jgi:hypothetical protein